MLAEDHMDQSQAPGEPEILNTLLAAGASVDARGEKGATPLHVAAEFGRAATTNALLAAGAVVEARDEGGRTPLHFAAGYNYGENAVQVLLAGGANLEARDGESRTPLHYALSRAHPEGARVLLAAGAEPDSRDSAGRTPLHYGAAEAIDAAPDEAGNSSDLVEPQGCQGRRETRPKGGAKHCHRGRGGEVVREGWDSAWGGREPETEGGRSPTGVSG